MIGVEDKSRTRIHPVESCSVVPASLFCGLRGVSWVATGSHCSNSVESPSVPSEGGRAKSDFAADTSTRSSSVSELASLTDHYRATGRLRRESASQAESGTRPSPFQVLNRTLRTRLDNLDLLNEARRSVIQYTPSRTPTTSTPHNSPSPPPPTLQELRNMAVYCDKIHT